MRLDRFSMILYIAFPVIGSICSIIMITHFVWIVQGSLDNGSYPEALYFMDMVRDFSFFEGSHLSYRVVIPFLVGYITNLLGITTLESIALIFGTWNFALFLFGIGMMLKIAILEQSVNVFELILPALLVIFMPFFLSAAFFPLIDAGAFLFFSLIVLAVFYRNLPMLFASTMLSVWVSEVTMLALLVVPALNYIRNDNWWQAYLPFILSSLVYLVGVVALSPDPGNHYLFNTGLWQESIMSNFLEFDRYFFSMLIPTFGLVIPFIGYRLYKGGSQKISQITLLLFIAYYIIFLLTAPTTTPQLMFMVLPLLVFFNFNDKTIVKD